MQIGYLLEIWGVKNDISIGEICARTVVMFIFAFLIIRLTGMRQFRKNTPFDMVLVFLIGGVLSRGVVGATPFFSTLASATALLLLQNLFYKITFKSRWFEKITKGKRYLIYRNGKFIEENMEKADVTKLEVYEDLRAKQHTQSLEGIAEIYVEKTGETSFIEKEYADHSHK